MEKQEMLYPMALTMIPDIGAITAKKLISYVGSPEGVFSEKRSTLERIPGIGSYLAGKLASRSAVSRALAEIESMEKNSISGLYFEEADYPWKLKNCDDGPLLLFYRGKSDFNRPRHLSIVGTRNATQYGKEVCRSIIASLSSKFPDLVIVSGLAYGIDITAHRAAIDYGLDTYAVLAHGLNTIYPAVHRQAASKISSQGALLSDFHSTTQPERNNFLRRNRIIAGLSDATLVVESGKKGGSLITAEMASSYSREVFAVPGRAGDDYSKGCNNLIKRNIAALIETGEDIEYLLNWEVTQPLKESRTILHMALSDEERKILEIIQECPMAGPEIISIRAEIPLHAVIAILLRMELQNWIMVLPGNIYKLCVQLP